MIIHDVVVDNHSKWVSICVVEAAGFLNIVCFTARGDVDELETIIAAHLLGVDPFDQPAVEEGKRLTRHFLSEMDFDG